MLRTQGTFYYMVTEGRKDSRTERRKDGHTEGLKAKNYAPPLFFEKAGDNKWPTTGHHAFHAVMNDYIEPHRGKTNNVVSDQV